MKAKTKNSIIFFLGGLLAVLIFSFRFPGEVKHPGGYSEQNNPKKKNIAAKDSFQIKTVNTPNVGWGFDILLKGKMLIHQPHIPAVPGVKGFKTEAEAKKVAELMKKKIQKHIMPPTIDIKELDSLKVKYK